MKDETIIKLGQLGAGVFMAAVYAFTEMNGMIILISALLLGVPIDRIVAKKLEQ